MEWIENLIRAGSKKANEVEAFYFEGASVSADLRQNTVSLCSSSVDVGLMIRIIDKGRIGSSTTNNPERWEACLDAAIAGSRLATPQEWKGLPGPAAIPKTDLAFDPEIPADPATAKDLIARMLDGASHHPESAVTSGGATISSESITLANSSGARYTSRHTDTSIALDTICGQSTGSEFDQSYSTKLLNPEKTGEYAAFLSSHSVRGKDIPTGDYDIILSPVAYADLLSGTFIPALSGRNVHQERSKLAGKIGEQVAVENFSLFDDPHRAGGSSSTWVDAEGTPTRHLDFVRDGILTGFAYDLKTAHRFGKESTGSAVRGGFAGLPTIGHHNIVVDGRRENIMDENAIYVQSVVGAHTANPMSGDFSVEISNPFFVRDGELAEPIKGAMLTGNFFDLHNRITGLGEESRAVGGYILPPVRVNNQRIIGK
ncbi:MAG: metallopeptidase TldD-related protein [Methanoregula sp.]